MRTTTNDVPCVLRLTFNPGGPGHEWLKKRYITASKPMIPFKVVLDESGTTVTRVFIPSRLADNPKIADPKAYAARIRASGPKWLVKAWLEGDWSGPPQGGLLKGEDLQGVDDDPAILVRKLGLRPTIYWDFAATEKQTRKDDPDYSACVVVARDELGRWWILDAWRGQVSPTIVARQIVSMQRKWQCRVKGEKGTIEKLIQPVLSHVCEEIDYQVRLEPISKGNIDKVAHSLPFQMILGNHSVYVPLRATWLADFKHELSTFPSVGTGIHDDWVDACSYAAQDLQKTAIGKTPLFGKKFHPEVTHEIFERFEEQRRKLERDGSDDDFWGSSQDASDDV